MEDHHFGEFNQGPTALLVRLDQGDVGLPKSCEEFGSASSAVVPSRAPPKLLSSAVVFHLCTIDWQYQRQCIYPQVSCEVDFLLCLLVSRGEGFLHNVSIVDERRVMVSPLKTC